MIEIVVLLKYSVFGWYAPEAKAGSVGWLVSFHVLMHFQSIYRPVEILLAFVKGKGLKCFSIIKWVELKNIFN